MTPEIEAEVRAWLQTATPEEKQELIRQLEAYAAELGIPVAPSPAALKPEDGPVLADAIESWLCGEG